MNKMIERCVLKKEVAMFSDAQNDLLRLRMDIIAHSSKWSRTLYNPYGNAPAIMQQWA
ncbi:MAG: hypothetical protein RR224_02880 [Clostridia bacterium]